MIDAELRVLAVYRSACAANGAPVRTTTVVDELLEERRYVRTSARPRRSADKSADSTGSACFTR